MARKTRVHDGPPNRLDAWARPDERRMGRQGCSEQVRLGAGGGSGAERGKFRAPRLGAEGCQNMKK